MPVQERPQKALVCSYQRLLVHQYEPDRPALRFSGWVKERAFQVLCA
jgi:hypothetical protein